MEVERYTLVPTVIIMTGPLGLKLEADGHERLEDILGARERVTSRSKIAAHELMLGEAGDADCRTWSQVEQVAFLPPENEEKGPLLSGVFCPQAPGEKKKRELQWSGKTSKQQDRQARKLQKEKWRLSRRGLEF